MYIFKPAIGDIDVVMLGNSIEAIKRNLSRHWDELLDSNFAEFYSEEEIQPIKTFMEKDHQTVDELINELKVIVQHQDYWVEKLNQ